MAVAAKYLFIFQALDLSDLKANWSETKYFEKVPVKQQNYLKFN